MSPARKSAPAKDAANAAVALAKKPASKTVKSATPDNGKVIVAAKAAPHATITLKQIAAELADGHNLPKKQAEEVLADLVTVTMRHLQNGDKIRLTGLGMLQVRALPARMGRIPATGEVVEIKARHKVAFRAAKELKALVC